MLLAAAREHKLDLAASVLFGDKEKDMQAAITAGVRAVFVSGDAYPGEAERCRALRPAAQGPTFLDAVHAFLALPREES